jgi:myo-inositol-1(or 4)-monophosphatase
MSEEVQQVLKIAEEAARKAGQYLLDNRGKADRETAGEKKKNDFVTEVDKTSEKMIIDHILSQYPDHRILAEESGAQQSSSAFRWIIDPLDGTTNFIHNISVFTVSVAVKRFDEVIAGVVFQPVENEMFTAAKGKGAQLNGVSIQVSKNRDFSRAFLATGFPHHSKRHLPQFIRSFSDIFFYSAGVRRLGSAALDLCYTACGRFDAFWETGLNAWDVAAGSLIVQEAGGVVSDFWGNSNYLDSGFIVAGNPAIQKRLIDILSIYFEGHRDE